MRSLTVLLLCASSTALAAEPAAPAAAAAPAVVPAAAPAPAPAAEPKVVLETTLGKIVIELYPNRVPVTVENFLKYVDARFYNGTVFHRVIPGFMIQGGGYTKELAEKPTRDPIKLESKDAPSNTRGTIAMARTSDPDSANSQFFISIADNDFLNYQDPQNPGYAAFGRVVDGMGVVDSIAHAERLCPSDSKSKDPCNAGLPPGMKDVPKVPIMIVKAYRLK